MKTIQILFRLSAVIILFIFAGCAASQRNAAVNNIFLNDIDTSKKIENMPFGHSWVWNARERTANQKIFIKPVRLDLLPEDAWKSSASVFITSRESYMQDAQEIARYFQEQLIEKLKKYPDTTISVIENSEPESLTLELALTELEFSHPLTHAGALAAPVPGVSLGVSRISDPHASFALRLTETSDNKLIATAADRKFPPTRLMDLNKVTVSSSVREICGFWAEEIAQVLNKGQFGKVDSVGKFRLLPW